MIPLACVMLASIIGNIAVTQTVYADVRKRTVTNIFILSQSAADLGTSILVMPFALVSVFFDGWVFGSNFCIANGFFNMFFTQVTVLQLMILAYDRYLVIVKKSNHSFRTGKGTNIVALAWCVSLAGSFPWLPLFSGGVRAAYLPGFYVCGQQFRHPIGGLDLFILVATVLCFAFVPLLAIFYSFYHIQGVIHRSRCSVSPLSLSNAQKMAAFVFAKSASTSKLIVVTTLIQVFPACFTMVFSGLQLFSIPRSLETSVKWIMWCHCAVKPIIYATKNSAWTDTLRRHLGNKTRGICYLRSAKCKPKDNQRDGNRTSQPRARQTLFQAWTTRDETDNFYKI